MVPQLQVSSLPTCTFLENFDPSLSFEQHGAIRTTLSSLEDYHNDDAAGFQRIEAREIDTIGWFFGNMFRNSLI